MASFDRDAASSEQDIPRLLLAVGAALATGVIIGLVVFRTGYAALVLMWVLPVLAPVPACRIARCSASFASLATFLGLGLVSGLAIAVTVLAGTPGNPGAEAAARLRQEVLTFFLTITVISAACVYGIRRVRATLK